jgi:hypothetical protein
MALDEQKASRFHVSDFVNTAWPRRVFLEFPPERRLRTIMHLGMSENE